MAGKVFLKLVRIYRYHILIWMSFILYESMVAKILLNHEIEFIGIAHYAVTIAIFYFFSHIIFTSAIRNYISILHVLICIIIYLITYIFAHYCVDRLFFNLAELSFKESLNFDFKYLTSQFFRAIYFLGFALAYYLLRNFLEIKKKSELLEKQRLNDIIQQQRMEQELVNAENAFLKAQINPHFLFNTLDFIYHQVHDSSPEAGEAIIDLSNMMRYAMDAGRNGGVEVLGKEIEQVETLIHLYQIRKRGKYCIEFHATDEVKELYLIPLVLLTLVENVFKHGELLDQGNPASIRLWVADGQLHICTNNGIAASNYTIKSGHGLVNTANRLHFAYGEHATLKSEQLNGNFLVQLSVPVDLLQRPAPPVPSSIKIDKE